MVGDTEWSLYSRRELQAVSRRHAPSGWQVVSIEVGSIIHVASDIICRLACVMRGCDLVFEDLLILGLLSGRSRKIHALAEQPFSFRIHDLHPNETKDGSPPAQTGRLVRSMETRQGKARLAVKRKSLGFRNEVNVTRQPAIRSRKQTIYPNY
jgi:hypothetical protein